MTISRTNFNSWASEWKQYLIDTTAKYEPVMRLNPLYQSLRQECDKARLICTLEIYTEYLQYIVLAESKSPKKFLAQSTFAQGQKMEYQAAHRLEDYSKKNNITYYDLSIMERISLAARFTD